MSCSNIVSELKPGCSDKDPANVFRRRQLMERQKWIENVMRIQKLSYAEAESIWLKIQGVER